MAEDVYRDKPISINKRLRFTLPLPPSVNSIYYNTRGGGRRLTAKAENYIRDARALVNLAVEEQRWKIPLKSTWLNLELVFYFPDRRRRDASNCLKLFLDAIEGKVYMDDMYALPKILTVEYDKLNPRVECLVTFQTNQQREYAKAVMN